MTNIEIFIKNLDHKRNISDLNSFDWILIRFLRGRKRKKEKPIKNVLFILIMKYYG